MWALRANGIIPLSRLTATAPPEGELYRVSDCIASFRVYKAIEMTVRIIVKEYSLGIGILYFNGDRDFAVEVAVGTVTVHEGFLTVDPDLCSGTAATE